MYIKMASTLFSLMVFCSSMVMSDAYAKDQEKEQIKKCISGLNAFEKGIKKNKPTLNPDVPRGLAGSVMLETALSRNEINGIKSINGSVKDVQFCRSSSLEQRSVNILIKAYHGYLPENPFDDLAKCQVAVYFVASSLQQKLGEEKFKEFAFKVGEEVGGAAATINMLYKNQSSTFEELNSASNKQFDAIAKGKDPKKIAKIIHEYTNICGWYDVPLKSLLDGVGISQ